MTAITALVTAITALVTAITAHATAIIVPVIVHIGALAIAITTRFRYGSGY